MFRNLGAIAQDGLRDDFIHSRLRPIASQAKLLDLGCGRRPFRTFYDALVATSVGIDVGDSLHGTSDADLIYDGKTIPFPDESFDIVLCTEVLEHVATPCEFLTEIRRVLKPGGHLVMTTPFMVPLHEEPRDFYRYTRHGIDYLLKTAGLNPLEIEVLGEYFAVLIGLLAQIQLRAWHRLATLLGIPAIATAWNPAIAILVVAPQLMYLLFARSRIGERALRALAYTPRGYGFLARQDPAASNTRPVS